MNNPLIVSLPNPDNILRTELPNGIVVLARANFNSPSVFMAGYLSAGSLFEPEEKLGLADFTALAMMRGTTMRWRLWELALGFPAAPTAPPLAGAPWLKTCLCY
jgi:hypothetical protein